MTIESWVQWLAATVTASISIMIFVFKTFSTKDDHQNLENRIDKMEESHAKMEDKIERKLELINDKLDRIILDRRE